MTAPMYRSQPTHPDSIVVTVREIDAMRDEIARLTEELAAVKREALLMTERLS